MYMCASEILEYFSVFGNLASYIFGNFATIPFEWPQCTLTTKDLILQYGQTYGDHFERSGLKGLKPLFGPMDKTIDRERASDHFLI